MFLVSHQRKKYGLDDFTPMERPRNVGEICVKVERYIPPYNGFGSYEDSLGNCFRVIPQPPKTDVIKFLRYDKWAWGVITNTRISRVPFLPLFLFLRQGLDSYVLRFRAQMISNVPANQDRQFIIRVFLMDDTVSIFELARRNSGEQFFKKILLSKWSKSDYEDDTKSERLLLSPKIVWCSTPTGLSSRSHRMSTNQIPLYI